METDLVPPGSVEGTEMFSTTDERTEEPVVQKKKKSEEQISKYRELLRGIQDKEKKLQEDKDMEMEISWMPGTTTPCHLHTSFVLQTDSSLHRLIQTSLTCCCFLLNSRFSFRCPQTSSACLDRKTNI